MAMKNNFQCTIREYKPSDQHNVLALFRNGILEHVYPAFFKAMGHPDHVGVALSVAMAGYVLGGSSYFQALLFGGAWAGLIYYCCHELYQGYLLRRLTSDMADIKANYLESPGSGFWVAEAEVNGQTKVVGVVAVRGKEGRQEAGLGERRHDQNGRVVGGVGEEGQQDKDPAGYGELPLMAVTFGCRRGGLGSQLIQKALDFCKERGYTHLILDTSSPQAAANALYQKFGFVQTGSHSKTHANRWFSKLARVKVLTMEKVI